LGHSAQEDLPTHAHATLTDRSEIDYANVLERAASDDAVHTSVLPARVEVFV
jgi:hypothetical protein